MGFPPQTTVFTTNKPTFYSAAVVKLLCLGGTSWRPKFSRVYPTQRLTARWSLLPGWYSIQQGPAGGLRARASVFSNKNSTFSSRMNPVSFDIENLNDQVLSVPISPYRQKQP